MNRYALKDFKLEFWHMAWLELKRVGLDDGIYGPEKDIDFMCMYCSF